MIAVLALAAALWGIGAAMKVDRKARLIALGMLYVVVLILATVLPPWHSVSQSLGGSPTPWLVLGLVVALILAYRFGLKRLRTLAAQRNGEEATPPQTGTFSEAELERYARHIVLREIGGPGQKKLKSAKVLVVGAGGLGAPALQYLAAAGVGTIGVVDDDTVELANLQRQVIHTDETIGMPKVFSAERAMKVQNPFIEVKSYHRKLDDGNAAELIKEYDLVLDGTDNFETRYRTNKACIAANVPLISGALAQWEGQLSVFDPAKGTPCYRCVFASPPAVGMAPSCSEAGVVSPLPGVVGSMMANEAVKLITGAGQSLLGEMLIYDALYGETRKITMKKRADCPDCGSVPV